LAELLERDVGLGGVGVAENGAHGVDDAELALSLLLSAK
jgi:hypothetical protein